MCGDLSPAARSAGFRLSGHQDENPPASDIAACLDVLGLQGIDHGVPFLDDVDLTAGLADDRIPITVCPTSNVVIPRCFDSLEDHVYPRMRAASLLSTMNTVDPALGDVNSARTTQPSRAHSTTWDDMVQLALDGVDACWLPESDKARLRVGITDPGATLRPQSESRV